jgi:predicted NAD/FAD-binding protein
MGGAIWSMPVGEFGSFPLQSFLAFFKSHGLLSVNGKPQWRTVTGGSRRYVAALTRAFRGRIRLSCGVTRVRRRAQGVEIEAGSVRTAFDTVVLAVHSDQALTLLADPSECESRARSARSATGPTRRSCTPMREFYRVAREREPRGTCT